MNIDYHQSFQRLIDESLAGAISAESEQSLREHLSNCAPCKKYLSASNRVIAGLGGFSFEINTSSNATVLAVLRQQADQIRQLRAHRTETMRQYKVQFKNWVAFAVALSMSFAGSALVYQMVMRLAIPMHFEATQVQAGVLVFWLLPSFCSALWLLAAPGETRGIA